MTKSANLLGLIGHLTELSRLGATPLWGKIALEEAIEYLDALRRESLTHTEEPTL